MESVDLSGVWRWETNPADKPYKRILSNDGFRVPGTTCENKIGKKQEYFSEMTSESTRCLREKYSFVGDLWLQRTIVIPEGFEGKCVSLFFERINMFSEIWIDDEHIGRGITELSAPHIYEPKNVSAGRHTLTVHLNNTNLLNIENMSGGYSLDNQGIWCGIVGKVEMRCAQTVHISQISVFPEETKIRVRLTVCSDCTGIKDKKKVNITLNAGDGEKRYKWKKYSAVLANSKQTVYLEYEMGGDVRRWDEFNPVLYRLEAEIDCGQESDKTSVTFGMRSIESKNGKLLLNGKRISLRGTLDCGIYPMTGYAPTELDEWLRIMKTVKRYGLNHIRFHSWCPPENAFLAADMTGVYVLAEMPLWLNYDVCALQVGDDVLHEYYFLHEAMVISDFYGNHPSFIMFSCGNENKGDFEMLEKIVTSVKAWDNRRLYAMTSNFEHPPAPAEDFLCAVESGGRRVRIQVFHDVICDNTCLDYSEAAAASNIPVISFETGQFLVYPNVDSVDDYTGNMLPVNFDAIRKNMTEHNTYHMLSDYIEASGQYAALLYKEEMESFLRTREMGGIQLLGLCDVTGQGTATVGLLDVFWRSKGIISPEKFREFCNCRVPLLKCGRIYLNTEAICAEFDLYDFAQEKEENPIFVFELFDGENCVWRIETRNKSVKADLSFTERPTRLEAVLAVGEYRNRWNIYVYPNSTEKNCVAIIKSGAEIEKAAETGGKFIVSGECLRSPIKSDFRPVFWSPAFFSSKRTCGIICQNTHDIFADFPTERYADFQWKHPTDKSVGMDISEFGEGFEPLVELIPNFTDNVRRSVLFEVRSGNADMLFCGFDLDADDKASRQLRNSIYKYVNSDKFNPKFEADAKMLAKKFMD